MNRNALTALLLAPALLVGATGFASASDDHCRYVPRSEWRSIEEAVAAVKAEGYDIREIERDDGCYEVKVFGKSGERIDRKSVV